ncbi:MAG: hypothetical protein PHN74_03510 [Candidatus Pacebacteria bacterium]|nr:hypothetical protein [Candidatus Paceibacterota bacterium]
MNKIIVKISLFFGGAVLALACNAQAAPEFLITWKANTFVPADYQGKIFPTQNSSVSVGFEVIDGGKIADISKKEIQWKLERSMVKSGVGLKSASLIMPASIKDQMVQINIINYKNNEDLEKIFFIPTVSPQVAINSPYLNNEVPNEGEFTFQALPFFFNVSKIGNLIFSWALNNQNISGEPNVPQTLKVSINSDSQLPSSIMSVSTTVQSIVNKLEIAKKSLNLKIK